MKRLKANSLPIVLVLCMLIYLGCKKYQFVVDGEKEYSEENHIPANAYDGGWRLILKRGGLAEVLPGGDIVYNATYKIIGSKIKVNTGQNADGLTFIILSDNQIKEEKSAKILKLKSP